MVAALKLIDRQIERLSKYSLVPIIFGILILSLLNIIFRWFSYSVDWIEPVVRHLVFISAFLGGVIATGNRSHIGIDIISKYLEAKKMMTAHKYITCFVSLVSCAVLIWLITACIDYVAVEAEYGKVQFLGIHAKYLAMILPVGLSMIAYRFFIVFLGTICEGKD